MSVISQFPQIRLNEVFERLDAGATVITPNRRLALALKDKFNNHQISQQNIVWNSADILPFSALIERIYLDTLYAKHASEFPLFPLLLTPAQEQVLWESVIQASDAGKALLRIPQTAEWVREAWQLAHAWQLLPKLKDYYPNEDGSAFQQWMESYERITTRNRQTGGARVFDLITKQYEHLAIKKPTCLICYGFDIFTPQQIAFLNKLIAVGCEVLAVDPVSENKPSQNQIKRVGVVDSQDEIYQAAIWARTRLETDSAARIGIVVPALASYRSAVARIFHSVMQPDIADALPGSAERIAPFNISLGMALSTYPLINAAFTVLMLVGRELEFERISHLLRSPFLAGGETEMNQRALLDAQLRKYADPVMTLEQLVALIRQVDSQANCPILMQRLSALLSFSQTKLPQTARHAYFAQMIFEILQLVGFPGERSLNSTEYQTVKKWHAVVADFATLDLVQPETHYGGAVSCLQRLTVNTLFQPETPEVPIQILGVLEAAGMDFDHLWVMGLSDEQWPLRPRPNPFLPLELQHKAKLPLGSTLESFAYSHRLTEGWLSSAREVVLSYPQHSDDRDRHELKPSPLIKSINAINTISEETLELPEYISHGDLIVNTGALEYIEDDQAPPLSDVVKQHAVKGGTAVIKDYAACPFRAWAKHRMNVESLKVPHAGLNAMERGALVHDVLAQVWTQLKTKEALDVLSDSGDEALNEMLTKAADRAIQSMRKSRPSALSGRFAGVEQRRLVVLLREWLEEEKKRSDFAVIATEDKRAIQVGELTLNTRLDRVDELEDGWHIVIDYKTSKQSISTMLGDRPDEPQLPLYLVMAEEHAAGVAFASLKRGQLGFSAIVKDAGLLPGVKSFADTVGCKQFISWDELIATWRYYLTDLAAGFASGDARVDPKKYPVTCNQCDMQSFCRIGERIGNVPAEQEADHD
jgi:ATP-dependent helicase/nuclease subunit B